MSARVRLRAFAKINLDLRVLHKRADGFHELRTIFQTISLADVLEIEYERGQGSPRRTHIEVNCNVDIPGNLVALAAERVLAATRSTGIVRLRLVKRIPLGAGLGGGSADAAAVLLALPVLLGKALPLERLIELAAGLGSDVPFFLMGGTAVGLGRGTELYPLADSPNRPILLITPGIHVSTADAYRALGRAPASEADPFALNRFQSIAWNASDGSLAARPENDFERVVFHQHPQLKSIKGKLLKLGAQPALMSGSGSTLFGVFRSRELRDRAAGLFKKEFGDDKVHLVSIVTRSRFRSIWRRQLAVPLDSNIWPPQDRYAE